MSLFSTETSSSYDVVGIKNSGTLNFGDGSYESTNATGSVSAKGGVLEVDGVSVTAVNNSGTLNVYNGIIDARDVSGSIGVYNTGTMNYVGQLGSAYGEIDLAELVTEKVALIDNAGIREAVKSIL